MMTRSKKNFRWMGVAFLIASLHLPARAEVILQYFNNTWQEMIDKMPEIAEVGYGAMWLPPPQKASGDLSVGYDLWDPFDLGGHPQRTGGRTRYGTEEELLRLIETAHRFGIRVYFDNIMNHRAFSVPGYDENTPMDIYPGMLPEDFHLQKTEDGFYRAWGDTVNWGSAWEVQNQNLSGLIDIAQESPNSNFGPSLGSTHPKLYFVRHPNNPEFYDYHPTLGLVGFDSAAITTNVIASNPGYFEEDTWMYLMRSIRWLVYKTKVDGLRLDAVKHVPAYFFGAWDNWTSDDGYTGQAQLQFNRTRGFSDPNHRDTMFDTELARDDLMVFGEHMGQPPPYWDFFMCGMRLIDAKSHQTLNDIGHNEWAWRALKNSDYVQDVQFGAQYGVYYAKSHDDAIAYNEHLHYANYLTRAGLPNIYTDGNRQAETLGQSGGAFPRHANTNPFGQWGDNRIPNLVDIHNSFSRGWQIPKWDDSKVVAYERMDKRNNFTMTDGDGVTMTFMMSRNYDAGEGRSIPTSFPKGSWLWQYADGGGKFYTQVSQNGTIDVILPQAGYFAFSWRTPEESELWKWGGGKPITLRDNGNAPGWVSYERVDGPDGDPGFNPYGVYDPVSSDFKYTYFIPRITSPTNVEFYAHVDGSAENVLFKLDGGVPLNATNHALGDARDNPPALSNDIYLGYEQADFHSRIWPEKFGSRDAAYNKIGSAGAEVYEFTVGQTNFTYYRPDTPLNDWDDTYSPVFVYHNPELGTGDGFQQFFPAPAEAADSDIYFHVKVGNQGDANRVYLYYTTDGSFPDGAGGFGVGSTKAIELFWRANVVEGGGTSILAEDNGGNYSGGWTNGSNGGSGFGPWSFGGTAGQAGQFVYSNQWGLWSRSVTNPPGTNLAEVIRPFTSPLSTGQVFSVFMKNGSVEPGGSVGAAVRSSTGETIWELMFAGGATNYTGTSGETGIPWTDQGLNIAFKLTSATAYEVTVSPVDGTPFTFSGSFSGQIQQFRGWSYANGPNDANIDARNLYFNNLKILGLNATGEVNDWWSEGKIGPFAAGTTVRYKVSALREQGYAGSGWDTPYPNSMADITRKTKMMGTWKITGFSPSNTVFRPHNDYGLFRTGLVEGFHMIQARAFLNRDNATQTPIYSNFKQTFYLDTKTPEGAIIWPANDGDWLNDNRYGVVVRTDPTVTKVYYQIVDSNPLNDDTSTGVTNGNGAGVWAEARRANQDIGINTPYPYQWKFNYINIPTNSPATIRVKLAEISSSTNPALSDAEGHFRTITRTVTANGPDYSMYVGWPQNDGDTVGAGYGMKLYFSQALWTPDEVTTRNRFLITINGAAQGRDQYDLNWQAGPNGMHELVFTLPDLYNGDPNYLHEIKITHTNAAGGGVTLFADRFVKAERSIAQAVVNVIDPPEYDLDGAPYIITLPDVANPSPTQRMYNIRVQTDTSVKQVAIDFTNSTGYIAPEIVSSNPLTGTVSANTGSTELFGSSNTLFMTQLRSGSVIQIGDVRGIVGEILSDTNLVLTESWAGITGTGLTAWTVQGNPTRSGSKLFWSFMWTNLQAGAYTIIAKADTDGNTSTIEAQATRYTRVILRETVTSNPSDGDDDDDGLYDDWEVNATNLPSSNPETWTSGDVHIAMIYGKTDPLLPDTDGDGLPDGLESGWRGPLPDTNTDTDTNGDGWKNFRSDYDPPFYNTVPDNWDVPDYNFFGSRTTLLRGSMTDPANPDTDNDGLPDGIEDANHNGWVDGDGMGLGPNDPKSARPDEGAWPDGIRQNWETWTETDPNNWDTDGDGASDGHGEDKNANGRIDGDTNSNRVWNAGELWTETDPLNRDTDGDGLPDGWEIQYGFDPLDIGIIGYTNMRTGSIISSTHNGASGNPDNDFIVLGGVTNAYDNLREYQNGTNPWQKDDGNPPPPGAITIGPGKLLGTLGGKEYYEEFSDWTLNDVLEHDTYEGAGFNNRNGDTYIGWREVEDLDGFYSSRDLTAFYARDGGDADGKFYFRVDMYDLQAFAEETALNIYVVIDINSTGSGEATLPDDVDTITKMKWEVVVACYQSGQGAVYVDMNRNNNSTSFGEDLTAYGVERRDQFSADGFIDAYFNSELDAVEFSISRKALTDAGWNGLDAGVLNYQVFVTKDGTCNGCNNGGPGAGDIGGRTDIRDSILDDRLAEDFSEAQSGIDSTLWEWIPGTRKAGKAKLAILAHANQAIQPGSVAQSLINNNAGGGYFRLLDIHQLYKRPLNLHITPTLASAIEWAKADPGSGMPWLDGPTFNDWIASLIQTNVVKLLASTFSDHMMPYFTPEFNRDNERLARQFLETIYGTTISSNAVFWTPERLLDADVFAKITNMGYRATVLDQTEHLSTWFDRTSALGVSGFQMNRINGVTTFAINNGASDFRFENADKGLSMPLRRLFNRKAQSNQDQVTTIFSNWEDFTSKAIADSYDLNMRWIANHPWIQVVTLEDILNNRIDITNDGYGDSWFVNERGNLPEGTSKLSHNYVNYATKQDYDNWYLGRNQEEGLQEKKFNLRGGVAMTNNYGMLYTPGSVAYEAWNKVATTTDTNLGPLARGVMHASVFQTAFHNQSTVDLSKYSNGEYINPDRTNDTLAGFAKAAQAQTRTAAMYNRVNTWLGSAASITNARTEQADVDLDGEAEYLLYNKHVFAVFERIGGRMIAAWMRDAVTGKSYQMIGNQLNYAGAETEEEGDFNVFTNGNVRAYRTSALKDWYSNGGGYVNNLYSFSGVSKGWNITSSDGKISKTVTLSDNDGWFSVNYVVDPALGTLYVRSGLNPDLQSLLLHGQKNLSAEIHSGGNMTLRNGATNASVSVMVAYSSSGHNASFNTTANDDDPDKGVNFATVNMRNQAQTHQIELSGAETFSFGIGLLVETPSPDIDGDGIPNDWEEQYFGSATGATANALSANGKNTVLESYIAGLNPTDPDDFFVVGETIKSTNGFTLRFDTTSNREYMIWYADNGLMAPTWNQGTSDRIQGTGGIETWLDDGTYTTPHPFNATNRVYNIRVYLPE